MTHRSNGRSFVRYALLSFVVLAAGVVVGAPASSAAPSAARLVAIRAAHWPGRDRLVFEFAGPVPSRRNVRYVTRLIADPSGRVVPIAGRAILEASFSAATATSSAPARVAFALPGVMTVVRSGDFEAVLSHGIGLAAREPFHVFVLSHPSRVVIDIQTPFATVLRRVYFENLRRFRAGTPPFVTSVLRPVLARSPATGVMDRLFAGPTASESTAGLRLVSSRASGFGGLSIASRVARVRLTGGCSSGGSTFTIGDEISPSLKQFAGVGFVKIYDPSGHTERPTGQLDSIPTCLEP